MKEKVPKISSTDGDTKIENKSCSDCLKQEKWQQKKKIYILRRMNKDDINTKKESIVDESVQKLITDVTENGYKFDWFGDNW